MIGDKYVFLTLDGGAWGRAALGLDIARSLHAQGAEVRVVTSTMTAPLARASGFPVEEVPENLGAYSRMYVESAIATANPRAVILCDFYSCGTYFRRRGIDSRFLLTQKAPAIALDVWDSAEERECVDAFGKEREARPEQIAEAAGRLVPVPIGRPSVSGGYRSLPAPARIDRATRDATRTRLGLGAGDRAVLFCTGGWQHQVADADGARIERHTPALIAGLLAGIDPGLKLIHVGPNRLPIDSENGRYRWLASMPPQDFDPLLGSVDLVLSANIAATTIGRAIALEVPVLVVKNSFAARDLAELEARAPHAISPLVRRWVAEAKPLYPFSMWPLGYAAFLEPVLRDNPYCSALDVVELTDEAGFRQTCQRLLFDAAGREDATRRQNLYSRQIQHLPTASELIERQLT